MTKARDIADFKFENITDTGTEGTKVASGTTAQRGSTTGQIRFNTTTGLAEYYTGTSFKSIDAPPSVLSIDISEVDSNAGGNQTIVITGTGFNSGATVSFIGNAGTDFNATSATVNSETQITAVAPKASFLNAQEPYGVKVINISGLASILVNQINVDTDVVWSTSAGSLGSVNDNATGTHFTVSATDADSDTITYSVQSGSLPAGMSLNSSTGAISGDPTDVSNATTSNFTLRASTTNANADRVFSITVNVSPITIDYLVVAGGGGGGGGIGGGGGAGGMKTGNVILTPSTTYTATVGGGGTKSTGTTSGSTGSNGGDSSLAGSGITTITSTGGGLGGSYFSNSVSAGAAGGSGGGAGARTGGTLTGGAGTSGQGNDGGSAHAASGQHAPGGGGGAGAVGQSGVHPGTAAGNGGVGLSSSITGSAVYYAGGGGGGCHESVTVTGGLGGQGGGGDGGLDGSPNRQSVAGTANTGGGGGAGRYSSNNDGANGGSGVVIFKILTSDYTGTVTGSPTITNTGLYTVVKFTGTGTYTA